jgi:asparagine synthase (glutamine-hydrolysing)
MTDTTFYGHPHFDPASVQAAVQADITSAARLEGEFAVATQSSGGTSIFCSGVGVTQLFYAVRDGKFHYGDTVSDVVEAAGFDWIWDYDALTNLAVFGHLIGKQTLHPAVSRVGKGELVRWNGSAISTKTYVIDQKISSNPVNDAIDALLESVRSQHKPGDVISVSAGFDSRVILAAFLSLGLKPNLVVMGAENSTDVLIASQIAKTFNLPLEHVPVCGTRGLADRFLITRLTSGTKTIENWHTYEYTAGASFPAGSGIWIGSNGEFARTFYVDRGLQFYAANAVGTPMVKKFWQTKISRNSLPDTLRPALTDEFLECLSSEKQLTQLQSFFSFESLAQVNDHLYLERVRQFIANGLRLVSTKYTPKTPFLDPRWIAAVQRMPRRWKLGNRWHRHAIRRLFPKLLAFPYDLTGDAMGNAPGLKYWLGFSPHSNSVPFFDYRAFVKSQEFRQVYASSIRALSGLFRNDENHLLLNDWPLRTTTYFAALSFYCEMLQRQGAMRMRVAHE